MISWDNLAVVPQYQYHPPSNGFVVIAIDWSINTPMTDALAELDRIGMQHVEQFTTPIFVKDANWTDYRFDPWTIVGECDETRKWVKWHLFMTDPSDWPALRLALKHS